MAVSSAIDKIKDIGISVTVQNWMNKSKSVTMLFTGKMGTGKSSLINGIVGDEVAKEGEHLDPETTKVTTYSTTYNEVKVKTWDSPGLQDGLDKEDEYIEDMKNNGCDDADLVMYCIRMDDTRFRDEDINAIRKLTKGLGKQIWNNSVFVLTFANRVEKLSRSPLTPKEKCDYFKQKLAEFRVKFVEAIVKAGVDKKIAENIPVVPVGYNREDQLPDRDDWLSPLWYASMLRMKERSQPALLKANLHRIKLPEQIKPGDFSKPLHEQPIVYMPAPIKYGAPPAILTVLGGLIGVVGGPTGIAVGASAGAALGVAADSLIAYLSSGGSKDDNVN